MDRGETTKRAVDAILEKGVDFPVTVNRPNILHRLGILPKVKTFVVHPITIGALAEISKILQDIDIGNFNFGETENILPMGIEAIVKNKDRLIRVLAIAIHNRKGDPPGSLIKYLDANLTTQESLVLLNLVVRQMSVPDFLACMVSVGKMDLMGTKQTSGESSEASSVTSGSGGKKSSGAEVLPTS